MSGGTSTEITPDVTVDNPNAGTVEVSPGLLPYELRSYQDKALKKLQLDGKSRKFAGLLVLPTGAGKTMVAVRWLLGDVVNHGSKVLWVAHRHELLNQAVETFKRMAYGAILTNRDTFRYRVISGAHDRPIHVRRDDDVVIGSIDSIRVGIKHLEHWMKGDVVVVIDEAHHTPARSYRTMIEHVTKMADHCRLLGLTATPTRTVEQEKPILGAIYTSGIVYKVDLAKLIAKGHLARPRFEQVETFVRPDVTLAQIERAKRMDLSGLGEKTIKDLAQHSLRNNLVVSTYTENRDKYGKTLVFAINIDNALALNALFQARGVKSGVVVSSLRDGSGASISDESNREVIDAFRRDRIEVLVNVAILTEGVDVPDIKSVFLARPTVSTILMTQMIGRALRPKLRDSANEAHIVSFVDDWQDKIAWVNPERLYIQDNLSIDEDGQDSRDRADQLVRLVSITRIYELARMLDSSFDRRNQERGRFLELVPVGFYSLRYLRRTTADAEPDERNREILVYDNVRKRYADFIAYIPQFIQSYGVDQNHELDDVTAQFLALKAEEHFFYDHDELLAYSREDMEDLIRFVFDTNEYPEFVELKERSELDVDRLAQKILADRMAPYDERDYLNAEWEHEGAHWQAFFDHDQRRFLREVDLAKQKRLHPSLFKSPVVPKVVWDQRALEDLPLYRLRTIDPHRWQTLTEAVFAGARCDDGQYECAVSGFRSPHRWLFEIDHIEPMAHGGKTVLNNLRLLTRSENRRRGAALIASASATEAARD